MDIQEIRQRIADLGDREAIKMLNTVAKPYAADGVIEKTLKRDQVEALQQALQVEASLHRPTDGDLARNALLVMAQNPEYAQEIDQFFHAPDVRVVQVETPLQNLDSPTLLYALRTSVDFDRDPLGVTHARITPLRPDRDLMRKYVGGLLARVPTDPPRNP